MKHQDKILLQLLVVKKLSQQDIGHKFNLNANIRSRLLTKMERNDLIRRENVTIKNPNQGGINYEKMVHITEKGIKYAEQLKKGNLINYQNLIRCSQCERIAILSIKNIKPDVICQNCSQSFVIKQYIIPDLMEGLNELKADQHTKDHTKNKKSKAIAEELPVSLAIMIAEAFKNNVKGEKIPESIKTKFFIHLTEYFVKNIGPHVTDSLVNKASANLTESFEKILADSVLNTIKKN